MTLSTPTDACIPPAAAIDAALTELHAGRPIGLPTETVYGLAADAGNPAAVARIFALKGRPADHPVIVHIPPAADLRDYARDVPSHAQALASAFWPGPLTLILKRQPWIPDAVTGGQDTVGLRMPAHPVAQAVLRAFGRGLAAPSANRFGRISPTTAAHVREEFGDALDVVLDGGASAVGIESTIIDCSGPVPRLLRPGMLGRAEIEAVVGRLDQSSASAPRTSGMLEKHYAPAAPLSLVTRAELERAGCQRALAIGSMPVGCSGVTLAASPAAYAHDLYDALRRLDHGGDGEILIESPPADPAWLAIRDRLGRAAAGSGAA